MPSQEKQQKKSNNPLMDVFEQIGEMYNSSVKQAEFMEAITAVLKSLTDLDAKLSRNIAQNKTTSDTSLSSLEDAIARAKDELLEVVRVAKGESTVSLSTAIQQLRGEVNSVAGMIPELPDYSDVFKGFEDKFTRLEMLTVGENVRNALEALPEGDKLAIGAVEGLRKELDDLKSRPQPKATPVVTDKAVQYALMRSIQAVTPSGTINGSNTDFEVPSTIHAVLSFELNSRVVALGEYSIVGGARKIIRFDTAPSASYSGKSFVITYI